MDEFEQRKRDVLQPIFFEAGAALFDCQSFEHGIAYLLYLFSRMGAKGLNTDSAVAILEDEEKKTAGQLIGMLKKHLEVSEGMEQSLTEALKARNKLIHRFLVENVERMAKLEEHAEIEKEIKSLRSKVRKSHKQLEPFVAALAKHLGDLDIDAIAEESKSKFMSDTELH
jgi:HPt (histidine-containing phosphotransfer) domain-containing protein